MKISFIFLFLIQFSAFAQCDTTDIVKYPDVEASFPGGTVAMVRFIRDNMEYPPIESCSLNQFTGTIYLKFTVCEDGSIRDIFCERCSGTQVDQMGIDLLKKMPNWNPAEVNDEPVTTRCRLPITICLQ